MIKQYEYINKNNNNYYEIDLNPVVSNSFISLLKYYYEDEGLKGSLKDRRPT